MGILRKLKRYWCSVLISILLFIIIFLRKDLTNARQRFEAKETLSIFNDSVFSDFVFKNDVKTILSQSGRYIIYPYVMTQSSDIQHNDVTIATHCSYYNLRYLPSLVKSWNGPISIAIFTENPTKTALLIDLLGKCSKSISNFVSFHVVVPFFGLKHPKLRSFAPGEPNILKILQHIKKKRQNLNLVCDNLNSLLESLDNIEKNYETNLEYPNNVLRNAAWEFSTTEFILNLDIDILPSYNMNALLQTFLSSRSSEQKTAFIPPIFEIENEFYRNDEDKLSIDKKELLKLRKKGLIRPFYIDVCPKCQNCTNYEKWYGMEIKMDTIMEYEINMQSPCEPFVLLPKNAPKFDERFLQYGYNRLSQVCELVGAGFEFRVLDNVFLLHRGFKMNLAEGFHQARLSEMAKHKILLEHFSIGLREKYAGSELTC